MKKYFLVFYVLFVACTTGNLNVIANLPRTLSEASGIENFKDSDLYWMINDSGNKANLYALDTLGKIKIELKINAKNNDWEDLTMDDYGNIFIGDFGNNANTRNNLSVLKVSKDSLSSSNKINIERISFYYPEQTNYPPKKNQMHFDCESFLFFNDSLYLFTKSRSKSDYGMTSLYKIPAKPGHYKASYISTFNTCRDYGCWVTSADISPNGKQVVLLTEHSAYTFTDFENDNFFSGKAKSFSFEHLSQKESICFKNDSILILTDERASGKGGNIYKIQLD